MRVGFIGLGIMGAPMAMHLREAGHDLAVFNRTASKCEPVRAKGAKVAATPREAAEGAEVLFICVSDTPDVHGVLFGPDGAAESLAKSSVVVDCSTISADATEEFGERLAAKGVAMLDAPLTGGDVGARNATLTIMVGGEEAVFQRVLPLFETVGKLILHMGPLGAGQRMKVVNQIVCAVTLLGVVEGMRFAEQSGMAMDKVMQVLTSGAAGSWALANYGPRILKGDFAPGFPMKLQSKDLRICMEAVREAGGRYEATALADKLFREAAESGLGDNGTQAMIQLLRRT
jgi:3-hydroxyisobutyrate dehydrogenase